MVWKMVSNVSKRIALFSDIFLNRSVYDLDTGFDLFSINHDRFSCCLRSNKSSSPLPERESRWTSYCRNFLQTLLAAFRRSLPEWT